MEEWERNLQEEVLEEAGLKDHKDQDPVTKKMSLC